MEISPLSKVDDFKLQQLLEMFLALVLLGAVELEMVEELLFVFAET